MPLHPPRSFQGRHSAERRGEIAAAVEGARFDPVVLARVRGEFKEMPELSPTLPEAERLFQLPRDACMSVLLRLVRDGVLRQTRDGRYRAR